MNNKPLLSFCIPTWNRSFIMDEALADLIPKIQKYNFEIIISDNASSDDTKEVVEKYQQQYDHIVYSRNEENIGPDANFEKVLKIAAERSEYSWLLGDSYRIIEKELDKIILILEKKEYALLTLNAFNRVRKISSKEYTSVSSLLEEIGWHITLISSLIFSSRLVCDDSFNRYYHSNFIQNGIIYEYLAKFPEEKVYWYDGNCILATEQSRISNQWFSASFQIFAKNWTNFILSLPMSLPMECKLHCIIKHNILTKTFVVKNLLFLKKQGWLNYEKDVQPYKMYIPYATPTAWGTILFISKAPYWVVIVLKNPLKWFEKFRMLFNETYKTIRKSN